MSLYLLNACDNALASGGTQKKNNSTFNLFSWRVGLALH